MLAFIHNLIIDSLVEILQQIKQFFTLLRADFETVE